MTLSVQHRSFRGVVVITTLFFIGMLVLGARWLKAREQSIPFHAIFLQGPVRGLSEGTRMSIDREQAAFRMDVRNMNAALRLGYAYQQAARETADAAFYNRIERLMDTLDRLDPGNPEVLFLRGLTFLGLHRFAEALPIGERLTGSSPHVQRYYGLLADAQTELGRYEEAVKTLQTMADLRPDQSALTRIAYLREIHGDRDGAIEIMQQALRGASGPPENLAWGFSELGQLRLPLDLDAAERDFRQALAVFPSFSPALAGLARVEASRGNFREALARAEQALTALPLPDYAALLGDLAKAQHQEERAESLYRLVEVGYGKLATGGTNIEMERASFLILRGRELQESLAKARGIIAVRQTIYAADLLAWALYQTGHSAEAERWSTTARRTGVRDPMILFHAGMIARALGKEQEAHALLTAVSRENPHFPFLWQPELRRALGEE